MERTSAVDNRFMIQRDLSEVLAINAGSREAPWGEDEFLKTLRSRSNIGRVAESKGKVVGFIVYGFKSERYEILNLAVARTHRGLGVGSMLLGKLLGKPRDRWKSIVAKVSEDNLPAQLFFQRQGFRAVKVLRGRFDGRDAYVMSFKP